MEKKNKKALILIAGGSGSGKTTLVKAVDEIVKKNNHTISFIRLDDYYHNQEHMTMEERRKVNYDHPKEFEWDILYSDIKKILSGKEVTRPKYDFVEMSHSKTEKRTVQTSDVLVMEGIFALYDKRIADLATIKVFVDTDSDTRLIRRIRRDVLENKKDIKYLLSQWNNDVKPMYDAFISKTKQNADIIIPNTDDNLNEVAVDIIKTKITSLMKD